MDYPARLLCPWDFPGKNPGVGCHFLLQIDEVWRTCCACRVFMVSAFLWMCVQMNIFSTWGHTSIILYCYLLKAFLLLLFFLLKAFLVTFIFQFLSACNCFCDVKLASHFFLILLFIFGCVALHELSSSRGEQGLLFVAVQISQCGSSWCRVRALGA